MPPRRAGCILTYPELREIFHAEDAEEMGEDAEEGTVPSASSRGSSASSA